MEPAPAARIRQALRLRAERSSSSSLCRSRRRQRTPTLPVSVRRRSISWSSCACPSARVRHSFLQAGGAGPPPGPAGPAGPPGHDRRRRSSNSAQSCSSSSSNSGAGVFIASSPFCDVSCDALSIASGGTGCHAGACSFFSRPLFPLQILFHRQKRAGAPYSLGTPALRAELVRHADAVFTFPAGAARGWCGSDPAAGPPRSDCSRSQPVPGRRCPARSPGAGGPGPGE